jgi:hypothetical protein
VLSQITDVPDFQSPPIDRRGLGEVDVTPPARVSVCLFAATYLGPRTEMKAQRLRQGSRRSPLNDSLWPFCQGL